jgi:hypothetical protein
MFEILVHDKKGCDTMGERIGRIRTDFFCFILKNQAKKQEKSVSICPIRPIRSPIVSHSRNFVSSSGAVGNAFALGRFFNIYYQLNSTHIQRSSANPLYPRPLKKVANAVFSVTGNSRLISAASVSNNELPI